MACLILYSFDNIVVTLAGMMSESCLNRGKLTSIITTLAPKPAAILAACVPTIPPPKIKTLPGGTPGTPPNNTPFPPCGFSRYLAPS